MAEESFRAQNERFAVNDLAVGQPIRVSCGILAAATGIVARISNSGQRGLKIDGWPDGVYVVVVSDATGVEPIQSE